MLKSWIITVLTIVAIFAASCSKHSQIMKNPDNDVKYEAAIDYYNKGDYYRAIQLFDQLIAVYRGTDKLEDLNYYYAYCHYHQEDYLLASYYFKRYAQNFPNSPKAEECLFMNAYCYYLDSPKSSLDQTNTYEAIKEMQLFINLYPDSERIQECNNIMDELRSKLEKKATEIAIQYFKTRQYKAAIRALENVLEDFPDTKNREDIFYYIMKSYYYFAHYSIDDKQAERYQQAVELYNDIVYLFPETKYMKELNSMHKNARDKLNN